MSTAPQDWFAANPPSSGDWFDENKPGARKLAAAEIAELNRRLTPIEELQARFRAQREPVEQGRPLIEGATLTGISALPDVKMRLPMPAREYAGFREPATGPTVAIPVRPGEGVTGISAAETGQAIARRLMPKEIPPEELTPSSAAAQAFVRGSAEDTVRILGGIADFFQSKEGLATAAVSVAGGPPASAAMLGGLALGSASELPAQIEAAKQDPTPENVGAVLENAAFVALLSGGAAGVARLQARVESSRGRPLEAPLVEIAQRRLDKAHAAERGVGEGAPARPPADWFERNKAGIEPEIRAAVAPGEAKPAPVGVERLPPAQVRPEAKPALVEAKPAIGLPEPAPIAPLEAAEVSARVGRPVEAGEVPEILRRERAEAGAEEKRSFLDIVQRAQLIAGKRPVEHIISWAKGDPALEGLDYHLGPPSRYIKGLATQWEKAKSPGMKIAIERDITQYFKRLASGQLEYEKAKRGVGKVMAAPFGSAERRGVGLANVPPEFLEDFLPPEYGKLYSNPLAPIADIYTKTIGRPLWEKGSALVLRMTPEFIKRGAVTRYGQPQEFVEAHIAAKTETALGVERAMEIGKRLTELPQAEQQALGRFIKGEITEVELRQLRNDAAMNHGIEAAKDARAELNNLGGQAVTQGLLRDETFFRNYGKYVPRMYRKWEIDYEEMLRKTGTQHPTRLDLDRFRKRQDIPADVRLMMGEILEPGYPVAKGLAQLSHDVAYAKLFNRVAENPEWAVKDLDNLWRQGKDPTEFVQMPATKRLGQLSGMYVNKYIADELNQIVRSRGGFDKLTRQLVSEWKFGKVILNPSTHARNMMSNATLAHLGGLPVTRVDIYYKALRELKDKGELYQQAKADGLTRATFVEGELDALLDSWNSGKGSLPERFAGIQENLKKGRLVSQFSSAQKMAQLYQAEEVWFKMAKYIHNREKGMDSKSAVADAHKWLFDYSEVPRWVDWSRRSPLGAPFLTFTYKALPRVAESIVTAPWRMMGVLGTLWLMQNAARKTLGYTEDEVEKLKEILPERMRGPAAGVVKFLLLPWVDKYGQLQFLDLTYILPWGDIGESGGGGREYIEKVPGVRQVAGLVRQVPIAGSPFILAVSEIMLNKSSFTGREIYKPYDDWKKQTADIGAHLYRTLAPSLAPGGYGERRLTKAITGQPDYFGRTSDLLAAISSTLLGLKITPIQPQREYEFRLLEAKRTLEDIAKEARSISYSQGLTAEEKNRRLGELENRYIEIEQKAAQLTPPKQK